MKLEIHISSPVTSTFTILLHLNNYLAVSGIFPDKQKVKAIFRTEEINKIQNYRSVLILNVISKLLESLIYNRLESFLIKQNILSDSKFGFRERLLIETVTPPFTNHIYK